jgi:hypothetical protein
MPEPTRNFCRFYPGQATWQNENSIAHMVNPIAAKSAPTAAPVVRVVQKTVFAFKKRPVIAPKGLQKGKFISAVNENGVENGEEINRVEVTVELENKTTTSCPTIADSPASRTTSMRGRERN